MLYAGKTVLIPLGQPTGGLQAVLGELGGFLPGMSGSENPGVRILAILQSRTLAEDVIHRLDLLPFLFPDDWDARAQLWLTDPAPTIASGVKTLQEDVVVSVWDESKGTLTLTAQHKDPVLAAAIANEYIAALQRALNQNAFSVAKKNRVFIEAQLQNTQKALTTSEEALQQFEQTYGIVSLDAQAQAAVSAIASLEAQIMAKEVYLGVLQRTLTGSSREVYLLREELQGLRAQLARLQQGAPGLSPVSGNGEQNSQAFLSLDKAPEIKLQYARLQRESLLQNKLFALLVQQLEQAKIEEVRDETAFQLLDKSVPPEKPASPKRLLMIALSIVFGPLLGIVGAFFREFVDTTVYTREQVERQARTMVLAAIPPPEQQQPRRRQRQPQTLAAPVASYLPPTTPRLEALGYLCTRLKHYNSDRGIQTLVFTSPEPAEEMAATLVDLALVAAGIGEKTLLIDSNLRRPMLHSLLQCSPTPGLVDLLAAPEEWQTGLHTTSEANLHFIPAGILTSERQVSLESSAFDVLLGHFRSAYDLVLFVAPPVHSSTDAAVLSSKVDATCLVLTFGVSHIEAVIEAKAALEAVQGKVIGTVLMHRQVGRKKRLHASQLANQVTIPTQV